MSHFSVLVPAVNDVEIAAMMLPYKEYDGEDFALRNYLEFKDTEDEDRKEYETETMPIVEMLGKRYTRDDDRFKNPNYNWRDEDSRYVYPKDAILKDVPKNKYYMSFEDYKRDWCGEERDKKTGRYGYWHNPNAKWDWYATGGRYEDVMNPNPATAGKVYWERMARSRLEQRLPDYRATRNAIEVVRATDAAKQFIGKHAERKIDFCSPEEYAEFWAVSEMRPTDWFEYKDYKDGLLNEDEYKKKRLAMGLTYAFIDREGIWHQRAQMGWWGIDWDEQEGYEADWWKFIRSLDKEQRVYLLDVHI